MIGIGFAAGVCIYFGFAIARKRRLAAECEERGHDWVADYTGFDCAHCGKRS